MHSKSICWGVLLLLLLWLCRENVRIIEPISFYPSEIFLSIVPLGKFPILHIKIAYQTFRVSESNSDDSIHDLDNSCAWAWLCSLAIRVWVYCHSLKLSDVPVFFFDDLGLERYCMCLFRLRNSKTCAIQLPPRPSVGQGAIWLTHRTSGLFAEVAKL